MLDKTDRSIRLLKMFDILQRGSGLKPSTLQGEFGITRKSVQRDINELRTYINDEYAQGIFGNIEYNPTRKEYVWHDRSDMFLSEHEILLLAVILLESRGLTKDELQSVINKIMIQCAPAARKLIEQLIRNELFYYEDITNAKPMGELIWQLMMAKLNQQYIMVTYKKARGNKYEPLKLMPCGIMFSEMYFYLIAKLADSTNDDVITFRIDRIGKCETLDENFRIEREQRFQEGIFRREIQFMNTGKLIEVKFRFWGKSLEAVLDRLSNAEVIMQDELGAVIKAKVYDKGTKMWFLSQAEFLEVLEPASFRAEMKESIRKMLDNYTD